MHELLNYASYMPHGYCLLWAPWLVVLYAGSDLLIALSYFAIPLALGMFLRRRPDLKYRGLVWLFAAFILLCGLSHVFSILTLWVPVYPLHGLMKLLTGLVSAATAVALFVLIPRLARIPSPSQLETANASLRQEIAAHETTLAQLLEMQKTLEARVESRTRDLKTANDRLAVVSQEAVHRSKNLLTVVSSLARQTARGAPDTDTFLEEFSGRLEALANANAAVTGGGHADRTPLETVARTQLDPLLQTYAARLNIDGPVIEVGAETAQPICLALHELATNALKYGGLATPDGQVDLTWSVTGDDPRSVVLTWTERGGARSDGAITERFGTRLLTLAVPAMLDGTATHDLTETGMTYVLTFSV